MSQQDAITKLVPDAPLTLGVAENIKVCNKAVESLFNELSVLAQQVNLTAQTMNEDGLILSSVAQLAIDKTCQHVKYNNIPILIPIEYDVH